MMIQVEEKERNERLSLEEVLLQASVRVPLEERVPGSEGAAFDLQAWYRAWSRETESATHLHVEAADEFTATVPWSELGQAVFLYEQNGAPLTKGYPLRLYVPDGSSACLHVKSVVRIVFQHRPDVRDKAEYGFKNRITPEQLRKKD